MARQPQSLQPAFVLHSYPYRETSLLIEVFSINSGRLALIARGAKRPKSALRGALMPFQPLLMSWSGKSELRILHQIEWQGGQAQLEGSALLCGFYLNELLINLLPRDDPHPALFDYYINIIQALSKENNHAALLRNFEIQLLKELGYALPLEKDVKTDLPVDAAKNYLYLIEKGPTLVTNPQNDAFPVVQGKTLLDMAKEDYSHPVTLQQSKLLMRHLINHYLNGKVLHTRQILKDLQQF
jgi:DNA repair protein RecO (recombination protein O)